MDVPEALHCQTARVLGTRPQRGPPTATRSPGSMDDGRLTPSGGSALRPLELYRSAPPAQRPSLDGRLRGAQAAAAGLHFDGT